MYEFVEKKLSKLNAYSNAYAIRDVKSSNAATFFNLKSVQEIDETMCFKNKSDHHLDFVIITTRYEQGLLIVERNSTDWTVVFFELFNHCVHSAHF